MSSFLKLPRAAQRAAFAHMGDKGRGRFNGSLTAAKPDDRGRIAGTLPDAGRGGFKGTLPTPAKNSKTLGAGNRHTKLTAKAERQSPGRREVDDLRKAYEGGHTDTEKLGGGNSADLVEKVKLSNGQHAIRKVQTARDNRAEYLSGRVANALGIKEVTVAQTGDRETVSVFHKGDPGVVQMRKALGTARYEDDRRAALDAEVKRQTRLKNGREIAMLDWVTNNDDRHELNWMVSPDNKTVIPIDHGNADFKAINHGLTKKPKVPKSPFVEEWIRPNRDDLENFSSADPQWTPAELKKIRSSIEALSGEFDGPDEKNWHAFMLSRLDMLEGK